MTSLNGEKREKKQRDRHVKIFIPVRIQGLFDYAGCVSLLGVYRDDSEGVGEPEDIAFGQTIRGNDCASLVRGNMDDACPLTRNSDLLVPVLRMGKKVMRRKVSDLQDLVRSRGHRERC